MDKQEIISNFSRYAHLYDKYAQIQKMAASELLRRIDTNGFKEILEIGCGTGNYTLALRSKFRGAGITAVDISDRMISIAKNKLNDKKINFIVADAENMNLSGKFDLVTSNVTFQWFKDLGRALGSYKKMLKKDGSILFSIFGRNTFYELGVSLKDVFRDTAITSADFFAFEDIKKALSASFTNLEIKETTYKEVFTNLRDLLLKIKYSGIRGRGLNVRVSFTASLLDKIEESYVKRFKRIEATYQTFLCLGKI